LKNPIKGYKNRMIQINILLHMKTRKRNHKWVKLDTY